MQPNPCGRGTTQGRPPAGASAYLIDFIYKIEHIRHRVPTSDWTEAWLPVGLRHEGVLIALDNTGKYLGDDPAAIGAKAFTSGTDLGLFEDIVPKRGLLV